MSWGFEAVGVEPVRGQCPEGGEPVTDDARGSRASQQPQYHICRQGGRSPRTLSGGMYCLWARALRACHYPRGWAL
eukprot:4461506-Pyramimonas_sp.AAC.1